MASDRKVLIAGAGKLGSAVGLHLCEQGLSVSGIRRNSHLIPDPIRAISADLSDPNSLTALPSAWDVVVYIVAAKSFDEETYRQAYVENLKNLLAVLDLDNVGHILFVSSSSVYGQDDGAWVDEDTPPNPRAFNGKVMLEAEQTALATGIATVVRFSGIYGEKRTRMLDKACQGLVQAAEPLVYSNRIHQDDCVGVLLFMVDCILKGESLDPIYIASDDRPCALSEVQRWIATQVGINEKLLREETTTRFAASKRLSNQRLLDRGYRFIYPNYCAGYAQVLEAYRAQRR